MKCKALLPTRDSLVIDLIQHQCLVTFNIMNLNCDSYLYAGKNINVCTYVVTYSIVYSIWYRVYGYIVIYSIVFL